MSDSKLTRDIFADNIEILDSIHHILETLIDNQRKIARKVDEISARVDAMVDR